MLLYVMGVSCHFLDPIDSLHIEILSDYQELLELGMMAFTFVPRVILYGESRGHSQWFKV